MSAKPFEAVLTRQQRDAAAEARANQHYTAPEVARLAADGKLTHDGQTLEPFTISSDYVRKLGADLVRARAGKRPSPLATLQPKDAIEALRVRLINLADAELRHLERQAAGKRDLARIRDAARCIKEAASIQPPKQTQAKPGQHVEGERTEGTTRTGNTGALLTAHRTTQDAPQPDQGEGAQPGSHTPGQRTALAA